MSDETTSLLSTPRAPSQGAPGTAHGTAALSRDLADFLVELQIALHKHAIYPAEHPLVRDAVGGVVRRLDAIFLERPVLSVGVARKQLVIEGVATDPDQPLLRELAQRLHRHHLGAVKFAAGAGPDEISSVLTALGAEPGRGTEAIGTRVGVETMWPHVRLFPLTFAQLELVDEEESGDAEDAKTLRSGHAAELWLGLAQASLAGDASGAASDSSIEDPALGPVAVARAIDDHQRETAYDQVVVGYLLQIAHEVRVSNGREAVALQRRISRLVRSLSQETLDALLAMGGDAHQRRRFVLDAAQGMSADAVIELARAAANAENRTISQSLLRVLSKLAVHAEQDAGGRGRAADTALREHVERMVSGWALDDPNPDAYRRALQEFTRSPHAVGNTDHTAALACEPERTLAIAIQVGASLDVITRAVDALVARGADGVRAALDLVDAAPEGSDAAHALRTRLVEQGALETLLEDANPDASAVARLAALVGPQAVGVLLDALEVHQDAAWRERVADAMAALGPAAGAEIARRLPRAAPATQRDLLAALGRLPVAPVGFSPEIYQRSPDPLVRREAARLALRDVPEPPTPAWARALRTALEDEDARVVHVALVAAAVCCPVEVLPTLLLRVSRGELDAGLRAHAVRVVAAQRDAAFVPWLADRVVARSRWLRRLRLRPTTPELLTAVAALGAYWREDPRARAAVTLAAASRDSEVRQALASGAQRLTPLRANRADTPTS